MIKKYYQNLRCLAYFVNKYIKEIVAMNNEKSIKDLQNEIIKQIKQIESAAQLFIIQKFLKNL